MQTAAGVILLLALGLAIAEALRAYLPATRLGTVLAGRAQGGRATDRLQRFGEARTLASASAEPVQPIVPFPVPPVAPAAAPDPPESTDAGQLALAEALAESLGGEAASLPAMLRIDSERDLVELSRSARTGDLWLRLSDFDGWPDRRERRSALVDTIAAHPEWDDRTVYEVATALALWADNGAYGRHRARNRKRVRRLRAAAVSGLVFLDEVRAERERAAATQPERADHSAA